ncbi:MAG TPA: sialidase family protein, partial [Tepidisphaeraceae bacterium]
ENGCAPARNSSPRRRCGITGLIVILCLPAFAQADPAPTTAKAYVATGFSRKTIYHSPQKPGYTSWVGAWQMPDKSLMVCFTQATGPLTARPRAPQDLRQKLAIPDKFDFTGLDLRQVYLRSADGGAHWNEVGSTRFESIGASAYAGSATLGLPDGSILRRVNGWDLQHRDVPQTAYLQRSDDGGKTWGNPQVLFDPATSLYQLSRLRILKDGRIVGTGQFWPAPAKSSHKELEKVQDQLLLVVSDDNGKTWRRHDVVPPELRDVVWDEWDQAELPDGDLLCVFRRGDPKNARKEVRWQGLLKKTRDTWTLEDFRPAPFPHSGHPELLATREGIILHIATTGIQYTADAGKTWNVLDVPGFAGEYKSRYYPRSLQTDDSRIYIFAHNGWDQPYGEFDQSIDMDTFRLVPR